MRHLSAIYNNDILVIDDEAPSLQGRRFKCLAPEDGLRSIRVLTYNIHRWAGRDGRLDIDRLAGVIGASGADVIGLNEVLHPVTTGTRSYAPLADLAKTLGMWYSFGPSGWLDYGPGWQGPVGNAVLSRYPLHDVTNTLLPRLPGTKQRSLLAATVSGGPLVGLTAFVTHLDHAFEGTRLFQIKGVLRRMAHAAHGHPHFLMGDFNTPGFLGPRAGQFLPPVLQLMHQSGYRDAFRAVGKGPGRTFPSHSPMVRIDFQFVPERWVNGLRKAEAVEDGLTQTASDHRPLLVEWVWPQIAARHELSAAGA